MREIKFRAWNIQKKEFNNSYLHLELNGELLSMNYSQLDGYESNVSDLYILMQFIGLHDSNGVEIWESDIVKYTNPYSNIEYTHVVKYDDNWAAFGLFEKLEDIWCKENDWVKIIKIEVIGNIYENPELL